MTTYAILHRGDSERCIRFFNQYCKEWSTDYEWAIRGFFKRMPQATIIDHPYCKINADRSVPFIDIGLDEGDTFIDFENNPGRRLL